MSNTKSSYIGWAIVSAVLVCLLWLIIPLCVFHSDPERFAAAEALFTGLAFAFFIVTLIMQREALELQRRELRSTQEDVAEQRKLMQSQTTTLIKQRFENTFFQLLRLQTEFAGSIDLTWASEEQSIGRSAFSDVLDKMRNAFNKESGIAKAPGHLEGISAAYHVANKFPGVAFQHYYGNLQSVLLLLDESDLSAGEQQFYGKLFRAILSGDELIMLFYHGLVDAPQQFKELVDKYRILAEVNVDRLLDRGNIEFYAGTFGPPAG